MNKESRILRLRSGQVMNHGKLKPTIHRNQGFTLIELLIVIAVLGILAVGVLVAINVTGNLNKANLAKAKTFSASVENDLSIAQVGKWSFEESSNPSKDTSGYGNDATWNGVVASKAKDECGLGFERCLQFNGTDSYIQATSAFGDQDFKTIPFSISLWVNPSSLANSPVLISIGNVTDENFKVLLFLRDNPAAPIFISWHKFNPAERTGLRSDNNKILPLNTWSHIVITHNGSEPSTTSSRIYLNGNILPLAVSNGSWTMIENNNRVRIGAGGNADAGDQYFRGLIDEVAIYKQSLTAYQIEQLYAKGFLKHYMVQVYPFNY